jgi:hypothetical protein
MDLVLESLPGPATQLHRASRFPREVIAPILSVAATHLGREQSEGASQPSSRATSATSVIDSSSEDSKELEEATSRWDDVQPHIERLRRRILNGTRIQAHARRRLAIRRVVAICVAATAIQAATRGWFCRNWLTLRHEAATRIARVVRGKQHKRVAERRRFAAVTITRVGRGRATRLWYRRQVQRRAAATTIARVTRGWYTRQCLGGKSALAAVEPNPLVAVEPSPIDPPHVVRANALEISRPRSSLSVTGRSLTWPGSHRFTIWSSNTDSRGERGSASSRSISLEASHSGHVWSSMCVVS